MEKKKVLLVDDEVDLLELMRTRVESWGYDVLQAQDGAQAIKMVASEKPDIIILDYKMPDMDGVEALKRIRKTNKKIPVIMFTAHPEVQGDKEAQKLGVAALVPKISAYQSAQSGLKTALNLVTKSIEGMK